MEEENKKTPKFLYLFCHYLMLASLGLFLLLFVAVMIYGLTPVSWYSYEFVCWVVRFTNWTCPILIGIFAASSQFAVRGFMDHRIEREWEKEDNPGSE